MKLQLIPVTPQNEAEILQLKPASHQTGFIESVADCLAEAKTYRGWRPVGIYAEKNLIGFAMYGFFWEKLPWGRVWLDRFLIDQTQQGKGYGKAALQLLIQHLRKKYHRKKIYLSVVKENQIATKLYLDFGFQFTGTLDINGEKIMVLKK